MNERFERTSDIELSTPDLTGAQMDESFIRFISRRVDSLTIDGYQIAGIQEAFHEDDTTYVFCVDNEERQHVLYHSSHSEDPVIHMVIDTN